MITNIKVDEATNTISFNADRRTLWKMRFQAWRHGHLTIQGEILDGLRKVVKELENNHKE